MKHSRVTSVQDAIKIFPLAQDTSLLSPKMHLTCADIGIIHVGNDAPLVAVDTRALVCSLERIVKHL
jgi:hypothetical protein